MSRTNKLRTKKWRDNKKGPVGFGRGRGWSERGGGSNKSLNLSLSLALSGDVCFVLVWPEVARRSPRKLPVSIQPYKLPQTPRVTVKMVTPIKSIHL